MGDQDNLNAKQDNSIDGKDVYRFFCKFPMDIDLDKLSEINKIEGNPDKQTWNNFKNEINRDYDIKSIKVWLGTSILWILLSIVILLFFKYVEEEKTFYTYIPTLVLICGIYYFYIAVVFGIIGFILILKELIPDLNSNNITSSGSETGFYKLHNFFYVEKHVNILNFYITCLVLNFICIFILIFTDFSDIPNYSRLVIFIFIIIFFALFGESIEIVRKLSNLQ